MKLSSAVLLLESYSSLMRKSQREVLSEFLYDENVQKVLANLVQHKNVVEKKVRENVVYRNLRKYLDILLRAIDDSARRTQAVRQVGAEADRMAREREALIAAMFKAFEPSRKLVNPTTIAVRESHRGLARSSEYHFVIDGDKLVHISYYAVSRRKLYETVEYTIDLNKLRGKKIVEITSSNSGIFCSAYIYPAEDLALDYSRRRTEKVPLSFLNKFKLAHLKESERMFLEEDWKQYYAPMISELRKMLQELPNYAPLDEYLRDIYKDYPFIGLTSLISCQIESGANYPLSFLIPYSEMARRKSLEALTKEIHQLWIAVHIIGRLAQTGKLKRVRLDFKQSSSSAIASFECKGGLCSLWYEFDLNPHTMCEGMLWYGGASEALSRFYQRATNVLRKRGLERAPLRPDMAVLEGGSTCSELERGFRVRMIIECKNQDYQHWAKDIYSQIIPYKEIFQPNTMVVASMKKVPEHVKESLAKQGVKVIDKVHPGGKGLQELLNLVEKV